MLHGAYQDLTSQNYLLLLLLLLVVVVVVVVVVVDDYYWIEIAHVVVGGGYCCLCVSDCCRSRNGGGMMLRMMMTMTMTTTTTTMMIALGTCGNDCTSCCSLQHWLCSDVAPYHYHGVCFPTTCLENMHTVSWSKHHIPRSKYLDGWKPLRGQSLAQKVLNSWIPFPAARSR